MREQDELGVATDLEIGHFRVSLPHGPHHPQHPDLLWFGWRIQRSRCGMGLSVGFRVSAFGFRISVLEFRAWFFVMMD